MTSAIISFKSVVIFADFVLISAKMTTLLKEMRIAQMSSKNERTLACNDWLSGGQAKNLVQIFAPVIFL